MMVPLPAAILLLLAGAGEAPPDALLFVDAGSEDVTLLHGARRRDGCLEFTSARQAAEIEIHGKLDGIAAMTVGGWFFPYRRGEQAFFFRGLPEIDPRGTRRFPPKDAWVNFLLGTDERGFLSGTIHGNGRMPFPYVTLDAVPFGEWSQIVVVKDAEGFQKLYRNGVLVATDRDAAGAGVRRPFRDTAEGEPVRLAMPLGGRIGEAWIVPRELAAEEVREDFEAKRGRYAPAVPARRVLLRDITPNPAAGLWKEPVTAASWPHHRERILRGAREIFGEPPRTRPPLEPEVHSEEDCGRYIRRKVSIQVQAGDRMPAWLLVPKDLEGRVPAVICIYGTTSGAGKDTTVGLSGRKPGTPPGKNRAFAVDMVEAGFVAFAPDLLRDGERLPPSGRPYDTTAFYEEFPDWSIHGKDGWDVSRAVDYLQSLDFVDPEAIGMTGHSYGGHTTIFATAFEPRIRAAVANGPVSDFVHHGMHWAVPKGASASQSLPAMRPYLLGHERPPITFYEVTALIAPRPLLVGQAVGERRPMEEENAAALNEVYAVLGAGEKVRYVWYAGDHDYPPPMRRAAVEWFRRWLAGGE